MKNLIYPVILSGGSGTRLWPRSREKHPKQFIPLIKGRSLFQETCIRFSDRKMFAFPTIITHEEHRFLVRDQLNEIGIKDACIITEPIAKNTAAACISVAHFLKNKVGDVPILFTPADHIISKEKNLFVSINNALPFVLKGFMCIFGIKPSSPHTGYGYITPGKSKGKGIIQPMSFVEKPDLKKAKKLLNSGAFWNSGIYFCTADTILEEATLYVPEIQSTLHNFFKNKKEKENEFYMIEMSIYVDIKSISIDKGITEHTKKLLLAKTSVNWNDLGSWSSLHSHFNKNKEGNIILGDTLVTETKNSYIESTSRLVATLGVENLGIIETADVVLVFSLKESESVKGMVSDLSKMKRPEIIHHTLVHRPWGTHEVLGKGKNFQSKKITVIPGAQLSLQRHKKRAEHWVVVFGIATVTVGDKVFKLKKNESTFIPKGTIHRLQNKSKEPLCIIEIQTGEYFGEDDIERFHDHYGRL